jgi:beta-glucosidase-like glycosyl hydrolase
MLRLGVMDQSKANPYINLAVQDTIEPCENGETQEYRTQVTQKSVVLLKNEGNLLPIDKNKVKKNCCSVENRAESVLKEWYEPFRNTPSLPSRNTKIAVDTTQTEVRYLRWDSDGDPTNGLQSGLIVVHRLRWKPSLDETLTGTTTLYRLPGDTALLLQTVREAVDRRSITTGHRRP